MITLLPTLAALGAAFVQPTSPEQFRRYFVGQWTVNKMINYKAGGISGRFEGVAAFKELHLVANPGNPGGDHQHRPTLLVYNESGSFAPKESSFGASRETRNKLLYDFGMAQRGEVAVFYPDIVDATAGDSFDGHSAEEILESSRFLYFLKASQSPGTLSIESHAENHETYDGSIEVEAANAFISTWRVKGDQQDGEIVTLYRRKDTEGNVIDVEARDEL